MTSHDERFAAWRDYYARHPDALQRLWQRARRDLNNTFAMAAHEDLNPGSAMEDGDEMRANVSRYFRRHTRPPFEVLKQHRITPLSPGNDVAADMYVRRLLASGRNPFNVSKREMQEGQNALISELMEAMETEEAADAAHARGDDESDPQPEP